MAVVPNFSVSDSWEDAIRVGLEHFLGFVKQAARGNRGITSAKADLTKVVSPDFVRNGELPGP
jgi:hypothetical protein